MIEDPDIRDIVRGTTRHALTQRRHNSRTARIIWEISASDVRGRTKESRQYFTGRDTGYVSLPGSKEQRR